MEGAAVGVRLKFQPFKWPKIRRAIGQPEGGNDRRLDVIKRLFDVD